MCFDILGVQQNRTMWESFQRTAWVTLWVVTLIQQQHSDIPLDGLTDQGGEANLLGSIK
jgi:hypothetical protein